MIADVFVGLAVSCWGTFGPLSVHEGVRYALCVAILMLEVLVAVGLSHEAYSDPASAPFEALDEEVGRGKMMKRQKKKKGASVRTVAELM